jgi:hypothetical protein
VTDPIEPPTPPSRAALAAVLAQAAEAEPLLADRPALDVGWGLLRIDLANGWSLRIWWHHGQMGPLHGALAPDGGCWTWGCDRWPDWLAGPDAVVLDPLTHLITAEQRERLRQRLLSCNCWPERKLPPRPEPPPMAEIDWLYPFDLMAS